VTPWVMSSGTDWKGEVGVGERNVDRALDGVRCGFGGEEEMRAY
jgi:hypothetical protein